MHGKLDKIWEAGAEEIIRRAMYIAKLGFKTWLPIYVLLLLGMVALPVLALLIDTYVRYLAGAGAACSALFAALRPNEKTSKYDTAVQMIWKTRVAYRLGQLRDSDVSREIRAAIEIMMLKYDSSTYPRSTEDATSGEQ
jgi:hypothetical protein